MWEIFSFFNDINQASRKEPERYHFCNVPQILEKAELRDIWEQYEEKELEKRRIIAAKKKKIEEANPRRSLENLEDSLENKKRNKSKDKNKRNDEESGIFDRHEPFLDNLEEDENDDDDDIFDILNANPSKPKKRNKSKEPKEETKRHSKPPKPSVNYKDEDSAEFMIGRRDYNEHSDPRLRKEEEKTVKTKHIFEIVVKELRNVVILKKILKDLNRGNRESEESSESKYIQDVFVKYIFPLDDEQIVSDYIEFNPTKEDSFDFSVSMHSYHTYLLETDKSVVDSLKKCGESFTMSLSCLKENKDMNIGNIQMPIEDLINIVEDYDKTDAIDLEHKQSKVQRILFLYGTRFSEREDIQIGKMRVDIIYKREIVETTSNRAPGISVSNDLYLQKEIYINRKIPLKGYLKVNVGALSDLKGSLENIEYLMSLYNHPDSRESMCDRSILSAQQPDHNKRTENIDRKRALLKIKKEGFNIGIVESLFEETPELKDRFGINESRIIFNSLNPNFEYENEHRIKMDVGIFEHLKYRFAVFEVRHYFVHEENSLLDLGKREDREIDNDSEFHTDNRDYITLGYAKAPLANLITKSNGIDQDVAVLDQFNQKLGYLKLKMSLNYQSSKNLKLAKEPSEKPLEGKYYLGFSFVELISQHNRYLKSAIYEEEVKHLIFKFKWNGENHQVRYIPNEGVTELPLDINVYLINKLHFIEVDLNDKTFEKSATPVEIQLWTKIENKVQCLQDREELIGSVFVDVQSLIAKNKNFRLRNEAEGIINTHDGYYTVLNNQNNEIMKDRVGISTLLIRKEYEGQKEELEKMFYILHNQVRKTILNDFDLNLKGTLEVNDMKRIINTYFEDLNEIELVYKYLEF